MGEQRRISHVGFHAALEDQLCNFSNDFDRARSGSPDRLDAMVWAFTELIVEATPGYGIIEYTRLEAEKVTALRANPTSPSLLAVELRAPAGASGTQHLMSGRQVSVDEGFVFVSPEDAAPLIAAGWTTTQNNLETVK
jgi:hypothetical protein